MIETIRLAPLASSYPSNHLSSLSVSTLFLNQRTMDRQAQPNMSSHSFSSLSTSPTSPTASSFLSYIPFLSHSSPKRSRKDDQLLPSVAPSTSNVPSPNYNHTRKASSFDPLAVSTFSSSLPLPSLVGSSQRMSPSSLLLIEKSNGGSWWTKGRLGNVLFGLIFWFSLYVLVRALGGWGAEISAM